MVNNGQNLVNVVCERSLTMQGVAVGKVNTDKTIQSSVIQVRTDQELAAKIRCPMRS